MSKSIFVDFDGVINSYETPFCGMELPDPPVIGAIEWLIELTKHFNVTIYTSRMLQGASQAPIIDWLFKYGVPINAIEQLSFSCVKVGAHVYIDDRGYRFEGKFPSVEELKEFKTWQGK